MRDRFDCLAWAELVGIVLMFCVQVRTQSAMKQLPDTNRAEAPFIQSASPVTYQAAVWSQTLHPSMCVRHGQCHYLLRVMPCMGFVRPFRFCFSLLARWEALCAVCPRKGSLLHVSAVSTAFAELGHPAVLPGAAGHTAQVLRRQPDRHHPAHQQRRRRQRLAHRQHRAHRQPLHHRRGAAATHDLQACPRLPRPSLYPFVLMSPGSGLSWHKHVADCCMSF